MIKTFRGLLASGGQERIRLETRDGKTGYRIKKLEFITDNPSSYDTETYVKIYSTQQTVIAAGIDFSEITLLAAGYATSGNQPYEAAYRLIIMDRVVFNQDIFIQSTDAGASGRPCSYYLELETVSLDETEATAVILKNFRNTNTVA